MAAPRPCGCKGIRTCLICEEKYGMNRRDLKSLYAGPSYVYCPLCNKAWSGWDLDDWKQHPNHNGEAIEFPGVYIKLDFLSVDEASSTLSYMDEMPWEISQSGRRKQNFGPKCNFKKHKVVLGNFNGFPSFSKFIQDRFNNIQLLKNYFTVEQCSLEYKPETGASIDPHVDDCWIWGERIITVNVLSDSVLTMSKYNGVLSKYNLSDVKEYSDVGYSFNEDPTVVRIPMPERSLLVLYGEARYCWEHAVLREDVKERRVCLAYRELTPPYLYDGQKFNVGKDILNVAQKFWDHKTDLKEANKTIEV